MIWLKQRLADDAYMVHESTLNGLKTKVGSSDEFMMVSVKSPEAGKSDFYILVRDQRDAAGLPGFPGFAPVDEASVPKQVDRVYVGRESSEFKKRFGGG